VPEILTPVGEFLEMRWLLAVSPVVLARFTDELEDQRVALQSGRPSGDRSYSERVLSRAARENEKHFAGTDDCRLTHNSVDIFCAAPLWQRNAGVLEVAARESP
jgi:hypothetical protein